MWGSEAPVRTNLRQDLLTIENFHRDLPLSEIWLWNREQTIGQKPHQILSLVPNRVVVSEFETHVCHARLLNSTQNLQTEIFE